MYHTVDSGGEGVHGVIITNMKEPKHFQHPQSNG